MKKRNERVPACYSKLKRALRIKADISPSQASVKMGYDQSFLCHELASGYIRKSVAISIEALFGVKLEEYVPDSKPDSKPDPVPDKQVAATEINPNLSIADRLSLDNATKAIEGLRLTVNFQTNQIKALTEVLTRMTEHMAHFDALFGDPMKLYRTIFIPMYNGIRVAEKDIGCEQPERRIDGTPNRRA